MADKQGTVLVVDDDDEIRRLVCRALGERHNVYAAHDALSAIQILDEGLRPNLMICDVMMPGMNGIELARHIRATPRYEKMPIVFLTAKDQPLDVIAGINAGARSYVVKPFKIAALTARVAKILHAA
jgi:DNA-binding response OmpR family regulator